MRGYYYPHRVIYQGSGNLDIWSYAPQTKEFTQVTGFDGNDMDPCPLPDGSLLYTSSRDGNYNIYRMDAGKTDPKGRKPGKQLTRFAPSDDERTIMGGVRDLSVSSDGSLAVFVVMNTLYTLDLNDKDALPVAVSFTMGGDSDRDQMRIIDASRNASEAAVHPSGEAVAVVTRGEIFIRSTADEHPSRRVTDTPAREGSLVWSPDGEVLYFTADDDESLGSIYAARVTLSTEDLKPEEPVEETEVAEEEESSETVDAEATESGENAEVVDEATDSEPAEPESDEAEEEEKHETIDYGPIWAGALRFEVSPVLKSDAYVYAPLPSPDGKSMIYKQDRGDVYLLDLESAESRLLFESWSDPECAWAADSVHVVFSKLDLNFNEDIFLLDTRLNEDGSAKQPVNLSKHPDNDHSPRLSADGKVLTFLSDRGSNNWEWDVYAINLDRDLDGMRRYELDAYYEDARSRPRRIGGCLIRMIRRRLSRLRLMRMTRTCVCVD